MRPLRTASIAVAASSSILQNHCSETIGSTRAPERWQKPTEWCSGSSATIRPSARSWASAASWPSSSESPSHSGFRSRSRPCSSMNSSVSSPWSSAISKSSRIVARRHLQGARAEPDLDPVVADDRHRPVDQRHDRGAPDQVLPARVVGVHRDAGVGQDRHGPDGRDHDLAAALDVVAHRVQHVVDLAVLDLEVGDGGLERPRPVHEPAVAVDVAALVQAHEHLDHGARVVVVHREPLAPVVHRRAEPLVLLDDHAAGRLAPLPHALDELLAPELLARQALAPPAAARRPSASRSPRGRCRAATARCGPACASGGSARPGRSRSARGPCAASPSRSAAAARCSTARRARPARRRTRARRSSARRCAARRSRRRTACARPARLGASRPSRGSLRGGVRRPRAPRRAPRA